MTVQERLTQKNLITIGVVFSVVGIVTLALSNALTPIYIASNRFEAEHADAAHVTTHTDSTSASNSTYITLHDQTTGVRGAESRPALAPPAGALSVKDFGAAGNGTTDDTAAILAAIAAAPDNGTVYFPEGTYRHAGLITVAKQGLKLWGYSGATLHATTDTAQSVSLTAQNSGIYGLNLTSTNTTTRGVADEAHRITVKGATGVTVRHNRITNGSGAGIFIWNSAQYVIEHNFVIDTLADAIHNTGGSNNGIIRNNTIDGAGDDCVAVVSYDRDKVLTHSIEAYYNDCRNGEARGMTVVGGRNVWYHHNYIERTYGAGMYIAAEQSFQTYGGQSITFADNELVRTNDASLPSQHSSQTLDHAAIFVYSDFEGTRNTANEGPVSNQNEDITIARNTIQDTVNLRAHIVVRHFGKRIRVLDNKMSGSAAYRSGPLELADVGAANYVSQGNSNNGTEIPGHAGF